MQSPEINCLREILEDCVKYLPNGSPEWPIYKNNPTTKKQFLEFRKQDRTSEIQKHYIMANGSRNDDNDFTEDKHQWVLRKQYSLANVELIKKFGVAACHEMTQLVMIKIKKRFPEAKVQFAVLKYYDHAFAIVKMNSKEFVFDLFAHGFEEQVIYSIQDLKENMEKLPLNKITSEHLTRINKKYHSVWMEKETAPTDAYSVKMELEENEVFPSPIFPSKSSECSLCVKFGMFAVVVVGGIYIINNIVNSETAPQFGG